MLTLPASIVASKFSSGSLHHMRPLDQSSWQRRDSFSLLGNCQERCWAKRNRTFQIGSYRSAWTFASRHRWVLSRRGRDHHRCDFPEDPSLLGESLLHVSYLLHSINASSCLILNKERSEKWFKIFESYNQRAQMKDCRESSDVVTRLCTMVYKVRDLQRQSRWLRQPSMLGLRLQGRVPIFSQPSASAHLSGSASVRQASWALAGNQVEAKAWERGIQQNPKRVRLPTRIFQKPSTNDTNKSLGDEIIRPDDTFIVKTEKKLSSHEYVTEMQPSYEVYEWWMQLRHNLVVDHVLKHKLHFFWKWILWQ